MSQSTNERVISTIVIKPSAELLTAMQDFKDNMAQAISRLSATPAVPVSDGLLTALQCDAANDGDEPEPELQALGQWVFEGRDEKWQSAGVDCHGRAYLFSCKKERLITPLGAWMPLPGYDFTFIGNGFENSNWAQSLINRVPVNDVDYLSDSLPNLDDVLSQPNVLSESVPPITRADLQLIFIKNLSTVLIQRMHSMDRFSEDDYHVGGDNLRAWDIVFDQSSGEFGVILGKSVDRYLSSVFFKKILGNSGVTGVWRTTTLKAQATRTITQDEINDFRAALETSYA